MKIKIEQLIPLLKKGWVAMDKNGDWWWFPSEPYMKSYEWIFRESDSYYSYEEAIFISAVFDIALADDWTKSLIKVGDKTDE